MLNAPTLDPHTTAFAVSGLRVRGSLECRWMPGIALRPAPHPIDRGVPR